MVEAKHKIPHYSYIDECDLTDLVRLRTQLRDPLAKVGVKLTYLAFFVKAAARLSVRAQDVTLDADAMAAAIAIAGVCALVLGYVPRLPEGALPAGLLASRGTVPGGSTKRLQRARGCEFLRK